MNKKLMGIGLVTVMSIVGLAGCDIPNAPADPSQVIQDQQTQKVQQAVNMMQQTPTPKFTYSVERQNVRDRLILTNNPDLLQWIYCISNGRVVGRFPVRGKVTSSHKRLTSPVDINENYGNGNGGTNPVVVPSPDETGTYGDSDNYVFWFDPSGNYYQWSGDYFLSTKPYLINEGYGTINMNVVDKAEQAKVSTYNAEIAKNPKGGTH